ncbi:hypothetical protein SAMN05428957_101515 [Oryzisolibacter propanilivorax]|uniref:Uncharacterized protein n=1 Tax=Oryzisolibacter propanilivorax TaxID=1527607 RepID=A0A1G9PMU6_9BURK|nr:hypothetical protein SAMN05428957_101515 [Oryzisolibacter propanilivorax]
MSVIPLSDPSLAAETGYQLVLSGSAGELDGDAWDALLVRQRQPTPFMRHAYLAALQDSASACPASGWEPTYFTLWQGDVLHGACVAYVKSHSYGEYVFDWAWARAYEQHGLAYYPKAVLAVPFTPVPGTRLLALDDAARGALLHTVLGWAQQRRLSSLHLLFGADEDIAAAQSRGLLLRHGVQFHWHNVRADGTGRLRDFDEFLAGLNQEKRKKIRQERRRVHQSGVSFVALQGSQISAQDWEFFYRCYERTYLEHGNRPYLTRDFFTRMAAQLPQAWLMFVARKDGRAIATSLVALGEEPADTAGGALQTVAYGRYWGALERVDCLHFEACYYQPIEWCIAHGVRRFEGGAQGEHKMARALLPEPTASAHWLAHPAFAEAVERFLQREGEGVAQYLQELHERSPLRRQD